MKLSIKQIAGLMLLVLVACIVSIKLISLHYFIYVGVLVNMLSILLYMKLDKLNFGTVLGRSAMKVYATAYGFLIVLVIVQSFEIHRLTQGRMFVYLLGFMVLIAVGWCNYYISKDLLKVAEHTKSKLMELSSKIGFIGAITTPLLFGLVIMIVAEICMVIACFNIDVNKLDKNS